MDKNNPATQLAIKDIKSVAKDVVENGVMGTASKRAVERIVIQQIKTSLFFNTNSAKMRGIGANISKLVFGKRKGWKNRDIASDYDFYGMQGVDFLSENLMKDVQLSTEFAWNEMDMQDTEAGVSYLTDIMTNALLVEFPIEINKRIINAVLKGFADGITHHTDTGAQEVFKPKVVSVDFSSDEKTKETIKLIRKELFTIMRLDNPLHYLDTPSYTIVITPELDAAFQDVAAYLVVGGDKTFQSYLSNNPSKIMLSSFRVVVSNELPKHTPALIFHNFSVFTGLPTNTAARVDYIGKSSTEKFYHIETSPFGIQVPYWSNRFGNVVQFVNATGSGQANAYFGNEQDTKTGNGSIHYAIKKVESGTSLNDYKVFLLDNTGNSHVVAGKAPATPIHMDGTDVTIDLVGLATGTYAIEIRYLKGAAEGLEWTVDTGEMIVRSANYLWENKTTPRATSSTVVNATAETIAKAEAKATKTQK